MSRLAQEAKACRHVLGFHPSSRGFGWVLFEDSRSLFDWGTVDVRVDKRNKTTLARLDAILDRYRPDVLAMESHDDVRVQRCPRIQRLYLAVERRAEQRYIIVHPVSRSQIASSPRMNGSKTRQEVAEAVAACIGALKPHLPKPRQIWVGERSAMRLFCAAACAVAYFDTIGSDLSL
jgi:Holliday junction resolvasome RuvABC endonuclease subunit